MKTKNLIKLFLCACLSFEASAQSGSKIWINGNAFSESGGSQKAVPFATISFYDAPDYANLAYFTVCGPVGNYRVNPYEYTKDYYVVAECPGYETRKFHLKPIPEVWNGRPFSGNATVDIRMEPVSPVKDIAPEKFEGGGKEGKNLLQLLQGLPGITYADGSLLTKEEGSVCLLMNGYSVGADVVGQLDKIPGNAVSCLEYYPLPEGGLYQAAVNVVLSVGTQAAWPDYRKTNSSLIEEEKR